MKKTKIILLVLLCLVVLLLSAVGVGGAAFADDGYTEIASADDWKAISGDGNYRLTKDIVLSDGTTVASFSGKLDGNGKTISGLTAPLFAALSGEVRDLTLAGSITTDATGAVGVLASSVTDSLTVKNLSVNCPVTATSAKGVGGLIGSVSGSSALTVTIVDSLNLGSVSGSANVSGFVGSVTNTTAGYSKLVFEGCINEGDLIMTAGDSNIGVGGLIGFGGRYSDISVTKCSNRGDVTSSGGDSGAAGIYGGGTWSSGDAQKLTVRYTSNYGNVTVLSGRGRAAGICGRMNRHGSEYTIEYSYNMGTISAMDDCASGIFGYSNSSAKCTIRYCYNAGELKNASRLFPIAGHGATGTVVSKENYYVNCKNNYAQENVTATAKASASSLNESLLALAQSPFVASKTQNSGYAILAWECTHTDGKQENCLGERCPTCLSQLILTGSGGHSFGDWVVDEPATETEQGLEHRTCSACSDVEYRIIDVTVKVTPTDGVYLIETGGELRYLFSAMESGDASADCSIRLVKDIDLDGKLATLNTTFTGSFDGNGKTVSGISAPLFGQFNGSVKNLTLEGDVDLSAASFSFDVARKAAGFAHTATGALFYNVVCNVNVVTDRNDLNAGGLVGYAVGACSFDHCAYNGKFTANWAGDGAGVGGIVGWSNAAGGTSVFTNCSFGGEIVIHCAASGKDGGFGGIVGNCTNSTVRFEYCTATGTITSNTTAGNAYVGGIVGLNKKSATVITECANNATLSSGYAAGGICGGMLENTVISYCANYQTPKAETTGAILGGGTGTATLSYCADFAENGEALCGVGFVKDKSYTRKEVALINEGFSLDGKEYIRYNVGVVEKTSGIFVKTLASDTDFVPYISIRDDKLTHSVRIVILTNLDCKAESAKLTITFADQSGKTVKRAVKQLGVSDSDFTLYSAVMAGGEIYFAAHGHALFGLVINEIPADVWESMTLSITDSKTGEEYMKPHSYTLEEMQLTLDSLPSYEALGTLSGTVYNAGPGLLSDEKGYTVDDCYMRVISDTTEKALADYVKTLEAGGYTFVSRNTLDGDTYYTYKKFASLIYLYHNKRIGETRIIVDNASDPLSELAYAYTPKSGETTELYQYSLNYSNHNRAGYDPVSYIESGAPNNGMCYIIKLSDNRLVVIDSGAEQQSTARSRAGLLKFMREITDTPEGEKVEIAMWFFTHAHGDHVALAGQFIRQYHDEIEILGTAFNFPSYPNMGARYDEISFTTKAYITQYYPDAVYHKLHTGESFTLADTLFEVVATHEDSVSVGGTTEIGDFNSTSTVLKITFDGVSLMLLGDSAGEAEASIVNMHSPAYLKSKILQVTHHCFNYMNNLYPLIQGEIALFPQSMYNCKNLENDGDNLYKYRSVMEYATEEYFAHKYTYKLTVVDGEVVTEALPRYDAQ